MANRINKRILADGRPNPRLGRENAVTYEGGGGFTNSKPAERTLVSALKKRLDAGTASDSEKRTYDALTRKEKR